jgi:TIR domain-containing protein
MKVFISWSGERSQALAEALRAWLPLVLHFVECWVSQSDIEAGQRWALEVSKELEVSNFGIICITSENISSPWLSFESGALAKSMQQGRVIPLLFNIEFRDISGPLAQFQAKKVDKAGLKDIVNSINRLSEEAISDARLSQLFEITWPTLEQKVSEISPNVPTTRHDRPAPEILEELVGIVRGLDLRLRETVEKGSGLRRAEQSLEAYRTGFVAQRLSSEFHLFEAQIKQAFEKHRIRATTYSHIPGRGLVLAEMMSQIDSAHFGVVDTTDMQLSTALEVGAMIGLGKPLLMFKNEQRSKSDLPFDIAGYLTEYQIANGSYLCQS